MTTVTLSLAMTAGDLRRLVLYSSPWTPASLDLHHESLFENLDRPGAVPIAHPRWTRAYWVGTHWETVMLVRAYLTSQGHGLEVLWDNATDPATGYVILTTHNPDPAKSTARAIRPPGRVRAR